MPKIFVTIEGFDGSKGLEHILAPKRLSTVMKEIREIASGIYLEEAIDLEEAGFSASSQVESWARHVLMEAVPAL